MAKVKAWKNRLSLSAYEKSPSTTLQFVDNKTREFIGEPISIPLPIMYRFYHLGRAYDFQTMKLLMPDGKKIFDWQNIQQIQVEIESLKDVIIDSVVSYYSEMILSIANQTVSRTSCRMIYVSP